MKMWVRLFYGCYGEGKLIELYFNFNDSQYEVYQNENYERDEMYTPLK